MRAIPKTMKAGDKILPKQTSYGWLTVKSVEDGTLVFVEESKEFFQARHITAWAVGHSADVPAPVPNYEQTEIQKVLDNEDVTEYRLKINDTKWLNVTREELFGIQKILGDKL